MFAFSERHYFFVRFRLRGDDLRPRLPEGSDLLPRLPEGSEKSLFASKGRTKPEGSRYTTHILH